MIATENKSRHSEIVENLVREVSRPMRGLTRTGQASFERIATKSIKAAAADHIDWFTAILKAAKPYYEDALKEQWPLGLPDSKFITGFDFTSELEHELHIIKCSGSCTKHNHLIFEQKKYPDETFDRNFGRALSKIFRETSQDFINEIMSKDSFDKESNAVFQDMYFNTIVNAFRDAQKKTKEVYDKQPEKWRDANPLVDYNPKNFFDKDDRFVKKIYKDGYNLVTSAITQKFLPGVKEIMNNALAKGLPYNQVASLLNNRFGEGGLWHWQRLVRTEMAGAIDKAHYEQFKDMEVPYVRMDVSLNACEICQFYVSFNNGYYPIEEAPNIPEDTHPNCKCVFGPVFNLPAGVSPDVTFPGKLGGNEEII